MKQIRTFFSMIGMVVLLVMPMTAFAASEAEAVIGTGSMESQITDAIGVSENSTYEKAAEVQQEAKADQEMEAQQETEADQEAGAEQKAEAEKSSAQETRPMQVEVKILAEQGESGVLQIENAAAGTGERLSGAVFAVFQKDGTKTGEVTLKDGCASLSLPLGDYYLKQLKAPAGYGIEPARIVFAIENGETTLVEITSEIDLANTNPQDLIPKTGQVPPVRAYFFSALCFMIAFLCGYKLWRMEGDRQKNGVRAYGSLSPCRETKCLLGHCRRPWR